MKSLWLDIRWTSRRIRKRKVLSSVVIGLIALGIGSNTLLFTVLDGMLLKGLPVRDPKNLFQLEKEYKQQVRPAYSFYSPEFQAIQRTSGAFEAIDAESGLGLLSSSNGKETVMLNVDAVSVTFFAHLGLRPEEGRLFAASDRNAGTSPGILSHRFWKRNWSSQSAIGRIIRINGHPVAVVGILPQDFHGLDLESEPDVTVPLEAGQVITAAPPQMDLLNIYVRLKPRISRAKALAMIEPVVKGSLEQSLQSMSPKPSASSVKTFLDFRMGMTPMEHGTSRLRAMFSNTLLLLMSAVAILLAIVCFNLGGLLLGNAQTRRKEIAIGRSIGASTRDVFRGVLIEGVFLACTGAVLGVLLSFCVLPAVASVLPALRDTSTQLRLIPSLDLSPDWRVLGFTVGVTALTTLLFSLAPALVLSRVDLHAELKQATQSYRGRSRALLVGLQVVLTIVLVTAAGLMVRTYWNLLAAKPGFDAAHITSFRLDPHAAAYKGAELNRLYEQIRESVQAVPGVRAAGLAVRGLMRGKGYGDTITPSGRTLAAGTFLNTSVNVISPGYFEAMGIRILEGRDIRSNDQGPPGQPWPVVVNEAFARTFFQREDPIGRTFSHGLDGRVRPDFRIVGVVSDAKYRSLRELPPPVYYSVVDGQGMADLYVRSTGDPHMIIGEVRRAIARVDGRVPVIDTATMTEEINDSLWQERLLLMAAVFFAITALLLASAGLFGALTQLIASRRRDIGVRIALGARARDIVRTVGMPMIATVTVSAGLGLVLSALVLKVTKSLLYGVSPSDPASFVIGLSAVVFAAAVTMIGPIFRAIRIDPASVLRFE